MTSYFANLGVDFGFDKTQFGLGVITSGQSNVSFSNVQAVVTGKMTPGTGPVVQLVNSPIAIWGETLEDSPPEPLGASNPLGSATNNFQYTAIDGPVPPFGAFNQISFSFGDTGIGGFGSWQVSPEEMNLTKVDSFIITGQLDSVGTGDPLASNVVSFTIGPGGIPMEGSAVGGFFTTQVPGPLPLAGVGAAFAWSRNLRRKQKTAASVVSCSEMV